MKTNEHLDRDHEWIGWMIECLESLVARTKVEQALPEVAYELLTLFEAFADGRHQDKEESVLFPALLEAANEHDIETLQRLLTDHVTERDHLSGMRSNVLGAMNGELASVQSFVREATAYLNLHRAHILCENKVLLPMAARLLTPDADEQVARGFEAIDGGRGDPHGYREQILSLHHRVGLPAPTSA